MRPGTYLRNHLSLPSPHFPSLSIVTQHQRLNIETRVEEFKRYFKRRYSSIETILSTRHFSLLSFLSYHLRLDEEGAQIWRGKIFSLPSLLSFSLSLLYFHDDNNSDIYGDCKKKKKKKKELFHASSRQRRNIVYKRNCFIGAAFFFEEFGIPFIIPFRSFSTPSREIVPKLFGFLIARPMRPGIRSKTRPAINKASISPPTSSTYVHQFFDSRRGNKFPLRRVLPRFLRETGNFIPRFST